MIFPKDIELLEPEKKPVSKNEKLYSPADTHFLVNEDDEILKTVRVELPPCPDIRTIDGYGLLPKRQVFRRKSMPPRLRRLEKTSKTLTDIWETLNKRRQDYEDEWQWIIQQWDRIINGYWFFLNGKPTYIDGWHYAYLDVWKIDVGFPEYRSRDRKFFLFTRYSYTTSDAYYPCAVFDKTTNKAVRYFSDTTEALKWAKEGVDAKPDDYEVRNKGYHIDIGRRTCYGINYPKHRREGATYKANLINYIISILHGNSHAGIQSMDGTSAYKAFDKGVIKPWRKLPFYLKPYYDGTTSPKKLLNFDISAVKIGGRGSLANIETGLETFIDYAESASRQFYDGDKLVSLNNDECGKTLLEDVYARWLVQKKCLAQGNGTKIHGLAVNTSTVGEMSIAGGTNFKKLTEASHWEVRNDSGQTKSGLFNLFIPAYDGLEGFIDKFGNSIIENPKEEDLWRIPTPFRSSDGRLIGAKEYLQSVRTALLLSTSEDSTEAYEEEVRQHPFSYSECFLTAGTGSGLNLKKITMRLKELELNRAATQRGNFEWENGIKDSRVIWKPDNLNGRWVISLALNQSQTNKSQTVRMLDENGEVVLMKMPMYPGRFTAGSDPFKYRKVQGSRKSKGGGSVFWERDFTIDPNEKPVSEWESYRTVCTYNFRPNDPEDYAEDMLMMCVYYGAMMFPEIDVTLVWDHFIKRKYGGYLKYALDGNGKMKKTPGFSMRAGSAQKIMRLHASYIERHCHREMHKEILEECKSIKGVDDITNWDLFAAVGASYLGSQVDYSKFNPNTDGDNDGYDISGYYGGG